MMIQPFETSPAAKCHSSISSSQRMDLSPSPSRYNTRPTNHGGNEPIIQGSPHRRSLNTIPEQSFESVDEHTQTLRQLDGQIRDRFPKFPELPLALLRDASQDSVAQLTKQFEHLF